MVHNVKHVLQVDAVHVPRDIIAVHIVHLLFV